MSHVYRLAEKWKSVLSGDLNLILKYLHCYELKIFNNCREYKVKKTDPIYNNLTKNERARNAIYRTGSNRRTSTIVIKIQNRPTLQLIRNVSFTRLDFIVSVGGVVGLFFRASILGVAEIVYIWAWRTF